MEEASIWLREVITPWDTYLHGASEILHWSRTNYQEICIVRTEAFGKKLFLDGIVQSSQADEFIYHESLVQPAAMAVGNPNRALILGGGEGAVLREILRWSSITQAVMVDLDDQVVTACKQFLEEWHQGSFDDKRTTLLHSDAVAYLRDTTEPFDVIVSDMTDPVEDGPSTFCFTQQYFETVNAALTDDGIVSVQAGPWSPVEIALHAKVVRTMATAFPYVVSYPCNAAVYGRPLGFAMASRTPIIERLDPLLTRQNLDNHGVAGLRYITPDVAQGIARTPPFVADAIAAKATVYTDSAPPQTAHAAGWERDSNESD